MERVDQTPGQLSAAIHNIVGMRKRGELVDDNFFDSPGLFPANMRQYMEAGTSYNVLKLALMQVTRPELLEFWWELQAGTRCDRVNANVGRDLEKIRELDPRSYLPDEEKLRQRTQKS